MEDEHVLRRYFEQGRSVILVMGHWGNWELAGARFGLLGLHQLYVIYHPLQNKWFDQLVYHMRTRLGNRLYPMKDTMKGMLSDRNKVTATAFIADQTPPPERAYWTTFMHQDTPVFFGTEKIAQKLGYPVVYAAVERVQPRSLHPAVRRPGPRPQGHHGRGDQRTSHASFGIRYSQAARILALDPPPVETSSDNFKRCLTSSSCSKAKTSSSPPASSPLNNVAAVGGT